MAKELPRSWVGMRREWPGLSAYQRFEAFVGSCGSMTIGSGRTTSPQPTARRPELRMRASRKTRLTLDHVELYVPDRRSAASWYAKVLGCEPVAGTESWAEDPAGPLMISPDGGQTKLALFTGQPQGHRATSGFHRVAFRVNASAFLAFTARMADLGLEEAGAAAREVDHGGAWSVYFTDPYGHRLEVTTYEVEPVRAARGPTTT